MRPSTAMTTHHRRGAHSGTINHARPPQSPKPPHPPTPHSATCSEPPGPPPGNRDERATRADTDGGWPDTAGNLFVFLSLYKTNHGGQESAAGPAAPRHATGNGEQHRAGAITGTGPPDGGARPSQQTHTCSLRTGIAGQPADTKARGSSTSGSSRLTGPTRTSTGCRASDDIARGQAAICRAVPRHWPTSSV